MYRAKENPFIIFVSSLTLTSTSNNFRLLEKLPLTCFLVGCVQRTKVDGRFKLTAKWRIEYFMLGGE